MDGEVDGEEALEVVGAGADEIGQFVSSSLIAREESSEAVVIEESSNPPTIQDSEDVSGKIMPL